MQQTVTAPQIRYQATFQPNGASHIVSVRFTWRTGDNNGPYSVGYGREYFTFKNIRSVSDDNNVLAHNSSKKAENDEKNITNILL